MRLIDADRLTRRFKARGCFKKDMLGCMVAKIINTEPTIDAVPVVRCKDCKHLMFSDCYGECDQGHMGIVKPWDFCSYGEREGNES